MFHSYLIQPQPQRTGTPLPRLYIGTVPVQTRRAVFPGGGATAVIPPPSVSAPVIPFRASPAGLAPATNPFIDNLLKKISINPGTEMAFQPRTYEAVERRARRSPGSLGEEARAFLTRQKRRGRPIAHSMVLEKSLLNDFGLPDPGKGVQAHHIVETSNGIGKGILKDCGIDPDSFANGVLLPTRKSARSGPATVHRGKHEDAYNTGVNLLLKKKTDELGHSPTLRAKRDAVLDALRQIRIMLLAGAFPLNAEGRNSKTVKRKILGAFRKLGV